MSFTRASLEIVPRILIVEDDPTMEMFWKAIIEKANKNAEIFWATSGHQATNMIKKAIDNKNKFDLVISDIYLEDSKTGLDLWHQFFKILHGHMIITSGLEYKKFFELFAKETSLPLFLQKPLVAHDCIEAIYGALNEPT